MLQLSCALVGAAGPAFSVRVDESGLVDDLKKVIKAEIPHTVTCDARHLELYLAKKGDGTWLTSQGVDAVTLNEHGEPHCHADDGTPHGLEKMEPLLWIKNDRYFAHFELRERDIHVLVVVPREEVLEEAKRRRVSGTFHGEKPRLPEKVDDVPRPANHSGNDNYMTVRAALLDMCGLLPPQADNVMLYRRRQVDELWNFVKDDVLAENSLGQIVGPPGTGKSLATLFYVAQLDPSEWNVVWIHLGESTDSCLSMGTREYWNAAELSTFVVPRVAEKRLLVCLDGYKGSANANRAHYALMRRIRRDLAEDERLLLCSSMATMGKTNEENAEVEKIRVFHMDSWTLGDYEAAVADASFYEHVKAKLDATTTTNDVNDDRKSGLEAARKAEKKKDALLCKFYYAGGSCRFMFQRTTDQVTRRLKNAVKRAKDKSDLIKGSTGEWHRDTINTLFGVVGGEGERVPVSSYAVSLIAKESGPGTIVQLATRLNSSNNPAVDGHLFEWLFLTSLHEHPVKLFGNSGVIDVLPKAPVLEFDPKKPFQLSDEGIKGNKRWLQPVAWNQGGYDAVYFDSVTGDVIFIQVMRSSTHSFKMRYFFEVLQKLEQAPMTIKKVEVYFVVKPAQCMNLKIDHIDDRDHLFRFDSRWTSPEEKHVKVRAFAADRQ